MDATPVLTDLVVDRLAEADLDEAGVSLVLAAVLGDDDLDAAVEALTGSPAAPRVALRTPNRTSSDQAAGEVFLRSIAVTAFRGIGPAATLELTPGPGLTVIAGRNGSGKSSFAEAAEQRFGELAITRSGEHPREVDLPGG